MMDVGSKDYCAYQYTIIRGALGVLKALLTWSAHFQCAVLSDEVCTRRYSSWQKRRLKSKWKCLLSDDMSVVIVSVYRLYNLQHVRGKYCNTQGIIVEAATQDSIIGADPQGF